MMRPATNPIGAARAPRAQRGLTMIELLVTMTVLGLLAMVAVPSFNEAILSNKLSSFSNTFMASAQLARSEAIKRNASMTMCRSADGTSCASSGGWQQGWIVFNDRNGDGDIDSDETRVLHQQSIGSEYLFTGDQYTLVFRATGLASTSASLKLCKATPSPGSQERTLSVSATGRVSADVTKTGTCS